MDTLKPVFLLSWLSANSIKPVGIFESIEAAQEAVQIRFAFINEALPVQDVDYKISEFAFNVIDD